MQVESWAETLLFSWEESLKGLLREGFVTFSRVTNGSAAWVLRLFSAQQTEEGSKRTKAWQSWWREDRCATVSYVNHHARPGHDFANKEQLQMCSWKLCLCWVLRSLDVQAEHLQCHHCKGQEQAGRCQAHACPSTTQLYR